MDAIERAPWPGPVSFSSCRFLVRSAVSFAGCRSPVRDAGPLCMAKNVANAMPCGRTNPVAKHTILSTPVSGGIRFGFSIQQHLMDKVARDRFRKGLPGQLRSFNSFRKDVGDASGNDGHFTKRKRNHCISIGQVAGIGIRHKRTDTICAGVAVGVPAMGVTRSSGMRITCVRILGRPGLTGCVRTAVRILLLRRIGGHRAV